MGKKSADRQYKADVPVANEQQIMEEWANHLLSLPGVGDRIGRCRPLQAVLWHPQERWKKREGLLVLNENQWEFYFYQNVNFDHEVLAAKLMVHPFVNNCKFEPVKSKGEDKLCKGGVYRWCPNDHLSEKDIGLRTTNNVGCLCGYSYHGDGGPVAGKQMTHAWAKITKGRSGELDGGKQNLEMLGNLLCEVCGFTFPFMGQFTMEGQLKNWHQPVFLTSAVGDIEPSAVGDILHWPLAMAICRPAAATSPAATKLPPRRIRHSQGWTLMMFLHRRVCRRRRHSQGD